MKNRINWIKKKYIKRGSSGLMERNLIDFVFVKDTRARKEGRKGGRDSRL